MEAEAFFLFVTKKNNVIAFAFSLLNLKIIRVLITKVNQFFKHWSSSFE